MANKLLVGLSSLFMPLGLYCGPAQSSVGYQRSYFSGSINAAGVSSKPVTTKKADRQQAQAQQSDELDIMPATLVRELVVIDAKVPDKQQFYRAIKPGIDIVEIQSGTDGLDQLKAILANYNNLATIHIVSHAQAGSLQLGNSIISAETLKAEVEMFAALNGAVREGGDLLLYGCDLAASEAGEELLDLIQHNTQLDVAASDDLTGNFEQGADWDLEIQRGNIEAELAFSERALKDFSGVLVNYNLSSFDYNHTAARVAGHCPDNSPSKTYDYTSLSSASYIVCGFMGDNSYDGTSVNIANYFGSSTDAFLNPNGPAVGNQYNTGTNSIEVRRTSGTFQLSSVVAAESFGGSYTFSNVKVVGYVSGGGTVESSEITSDGVAANTFTFSGANMSAFAGVNLTKFRLVFVNQQGSHIGYLNLKSFDATPDSTPPTVSSIISSTANGTYKAGDVISVQVNFSETVFVANGTPQLTLETGATDRTINYASGSGTNTLNFSYTVQAGDTAADLDYVATNSLTLNGATIRDGSSNNATLALPNPGAANSLGANKNIVIDGVTPTVSSVTASTANGSYKAGDVISIQVNFSEVVTVTGTPQLTLETGTTDRTINYASGSGSSTLTFSYTIQAGDISSDLDYVATNSLSLNGGTIRDAATNNATLTLASPGAANSLGANKALVVDAVAPSVTSTVPVGGSLSTDTSVDFTVNFSESVSNISIDDFALGTTGSATGTITGISASVGSSVTVTVSGISGNGTIKLNLNGATDIADSLGNAFPAAYTSGTTHTVAIPTAPDAPTIGAATPGDGQVSVAFTAPGNNGGSAITGYTVTSNPGGFTGGGNGFTTSPITVAGLSNGTAYTFTVTAMNAIGTSTTSGTSASATPKGGQTITFAQPAAQNYGTTPTLTATAASATGTDGLTVSFSSSTTGVCTTTSGGALTFVTAGSCTINADQSGDTATNAAPTVSRTFAVNAVAPGAPTIGTATAGNQQATVSFTAPASSGGVGITNYTVTASPGGATATGTGSPITVTGLTNGLAYSFTVTATNAQPLTGSASAASNVVTPKASQTISFANPGSKSFGTSPTLTASSSAGVGYDVTFTSSTTGVCTVTSEGVLTFITAGNCTIHANQAGDSAFLPAAEVSQSFSVTPVVPAVPTSVTATAGNTQASVAFAPPSSNGGSNVTGYVVTVAPAHVAPVTGASSPIVVGGLTNGVSYTFTVQAENSAGLGAASSASNAVTPKATQTLTFVNPGPQTFGTSPTLTATTDATGGLVPTFTSSTPAVCTITSGGVLTFVTAGDCTISADQAGDASYLAATQVTQSFTVNAITPNAPASVTATAGNASATVAFSAPTDTGGVAITGYTVTSTPGNLTATGTSSPIQITGLTNGTSYTFTVRATNSAGQGAASASSNAVTPAAPATNTAPVISGSPATTVARGGSYSFTPSAFDADGQLLTFSISTLPGWASFSSSTGALTGTPAATDVGTTSGIVISVSDGTATASLPAFSITVEGSNVAPVAADGAATTAEDTPVSLSLTAQDADQNQLSYEIVSAPAHGSVTLQGSTVVYTPERNYHGTDSLSFIAKDAALSSNTASISLTVTPVNDAPVAVDDSFTQERVASNQYALAVLANDTDVDGDPLRIDGASTTVGSVSFSADSLSLTVPALYVGPVTLRYSVTDGKGGRGTATVGLLIEGGNAANLPVITVPADIVVNATGLSTRVALGTATAVDRNGNRLSVSLNRGEPLFEPGEHTVYWQATDAAGNTATKAQKVSVRPLVSLSKDQVVTEGSDVSVDIILNGPSPVYPVLVPYSVSGSADGTDHTLTSGVAEISSGVGTSISFTVLEDGQADPQEDIVISLGAVNQGSKNSTRIEVSDQNIAPVVTLGVTQSGENRLTVAQNGGAVTISATLSDANATDVLTGNWTLGGLTNASAEQTQLSFDPAEQGPGLYQVSYTVTDNGSPALSATSSVFVVVQASLPTLGAIDSDGDLIPDNEEGFADSDGDGIPDYQDAISECNVMPTELLGQTQFLAEGDPGVCLRLGTVAAQTNAGGLQIKQESIQVDPVAVYIGGIFDFIAYGLPEQGQSYSLAIPQRAPVPANAGYRKYSDATGWVAFVRNEKNSVSSSPGEAGYCPPPGDASWTPGLTEGHWCVQVTVEDGGPNDADGVANGAIVDPGGVAVALSSNRLPVAVADTAKTQENTAVVVNVLANDTDADGDSLRISQAVANFGAVTILDNQTLSYMPTTDFKGVDKVVYSITDGKGGTASAELLVDVSGNTAPVAADDVASTDDKTAVLIAVLANDRDADGHSLTVSAASAQQGTVRIEADQRLRYTPKAGFDGVDIISYRVTDSQGGEASAQVRVTVTALKDVVVDNKSGGGSMTLWMVLALAGAVVLRRRSVVGLAAVVLLWFSPVSQAEQWSLSVSAGQSKAESRTAPAGSTVLAQDNTDSLKGLGLSYSLSPKVALELGYLDLGQASLQLQAQSLTPAEYHQAVKDVTPVLGEGWTAGVRFSLWQQQGWAIQAPLGLYRWQVDLSSRMANSSLNSSLKGTDWYAGLELSKELSTAWLLGLGYQRLKLDSAAVDAIMLRLSYGF